MLVIYHDSLSCSFQAGSANLSNLNPASHLLLSLREQENLTRNSSLSSLPKVSRMFCELICIVLFNDLFVAYHVLLLTQGCSVQSFLLAVLEMHYFQAHESVFYISFCSNSNKLKFFSGLLHNQWLTVAYLLAYYSSSLASLYSNDWCHCICGHYVCHHCHHQ